MSLETCKHTDADKCDCICHQPTESGEPAALHIIQCCDMCGVCKRWIDQYKSVHLKTNA
jgi:hypothetical protein